MSRRDPDALRIRSAFVRDRVREIAERTGMTATEIVEDALRGYVPPVEPAAPHGLIRKGPLLVHPGRGRIITHEETEAAIEAARLREP